MIILEPVIHETVWGGNRLNSYIKGKDGKTGHLYLANGHKDLSNRVLNGVHAGAALDQIFSIEKKNWGMEEYDQFPLTIALVDAKENLSIQVHPDDRAAEVLEKERIGKTESWIFLEEPESQWIYAGCSCSTKEELVYIGKNPTRYHRQRTCHYLYNDLKAVSAGEVESMRNQSGGKYVPCKTCGTGNGNGTGTVYIMPYGGSYHTVRTCPSIIAYVQAVALSQVEYLGECSYCGGK